MRSFLGFAWVLGVVSSGCRRLNSAILQTVQDFGRQDLEESSVKIHVPGTLLLAIGRSVLLETEIKYVEVNGRRRI